MANFKASVDPVERARQRAFYEAHRDELKAYARAYYRKNREKLLAQGKAYYLKNREALRQYSRNYSASHKDNHRAYKVGYHYGLSEGDFQALLRAQDGLCAICKGELALERRGAHVDHEHEGKRRLRTSIKQVRGLLCANCNYGLGNFKDNPEFLEAAIRYLANPPANDVLLSVAQPDLFGVAS